MLTEGPKNPRECKADGGMEDLDIGNCLQYLEVYPLNTRYMKQQGFLMNFRGNSDKGVKYICVRTSTLDPNMEKQSEFWDNSKSCRNYISISRVLLAFVLIFALFEII